MAKAENSPTDSNGEDEELEHYEKDVVITAYGPSEDAFEEKREFANETIGSDIDVDLMEQYTSTNERKRLEVEIEAEDYNGDIQEFDYTYSPFRSREQEALINALKDEPLPDCMNLVEETKHTTHYSHSPRSVIDNFVEDLFEKDSLEELGFESSGSFYTGRWVREVDDPSSDSDFGAVAQNVSVSAGDNIKSTRVLAHQSERSQTNRFETEDEHWSFESTVHIEACSDEELNEISEALVPEIYSELASITGIEKVRLSDCKKKVEKQGECYDL